MGAFSPLNAAGFVCPKKLAVALRWYVCVHKDVRRPTGAERIASDTPRRREGHPGIRRRGLRLGPARPESVCPHQPAPGTLRVPRAGDRDPAHRPRPQARRAAGGAPDAALRLRSQVTVLGGVLAVPCNPQAALAGLNPLSRGPGPRVSALPVALMVRSRDDGDP
jgi:hypothetical protein